VIHLGYSFLNVIILFYHRGIGSTIRESPTRHKNILINCRLQSTRALIVLMYDHFMSASLHAWDLPPEEAIRVQNEMQERLVLKWDGRPVHTIGGVDISIQSDMTRAAIVVIRYGDLAPLAAVTADTPLVFPYVPGLLAFRDGLAVLAAWDLLREKPDILMSDGQGIAHPRALGIAVHMGLWLELPTIGVAKSRLYGKHEEVGPHQGDQADLIGKDGKVIGAVLRPKERTNPLYVSPGHMMDVPYATEFVLACLAGYRLPEPARWAHKVASGEKLPSRQGDQPLLF
jgi:deoxyribonuclease V